MNGDGQIVNPIGVGWTVETTVAHILALIDLNDRRYSERFEAGQQAVNAALAAADRAVLKAENANEKRFDSVNEFRATLADQQRTLMPRQEADIQLGALRDRIKALEDQGIARIGASQGQHSQWGYIVGGIGLVSTIIAIVFEIARAALR